MYVHIIEWQQSGLTQKAYCTQNDLAYHVFHYWYKYYRAEKSAAVSNTSSFMQLCTASGGQVQPSLPVVAVELLLSDGRRLLFHQLVSSEYLKSLIS